MKEIQESAFADSSMRNAPRRFAMFKNSYNIAIAVPNESTGTSKMFGGLLSVSGLFSAMVMMRSCFFSCNPFFSTALERSFYTVYTTPRGITFAGIIDSPPVSMTWASGTGYTSTQWTERLFRIRSVQRCILVRMWVRIYRYHFSVYTQMHTDV